jgi:hypothetical protein
LSTVLAMVQSKSRVNVGSAFFVTTRSVGGGGVAGVMWKASYLHWLGFVAPVSQIARMYTPPGLSVSSNGARPMMKRPFGLVPTAWVPP